MNANLITGLDHPSELCIDSTGSDLFVVNDYSGTVGEYTTSGAVVNASLISGLIIPSNLALSGSNLFVSSLNSATIGEYTTSGAVVNASLISGLPGSGEGLFVFGSDLFVSTYTTGIISEYTTSGELVNASLVSGLSNPADIIVTPEPASAALIAAAGLGLLLRRSRRSRVFIA